MDTVIQGALTVVMTAGLWVAIRAVAATPEGAEAKVAVEVFCSVQSPRGNHHPRHSAQAAVSPQMALGPSRRSYRCAGRNTR